jgi:peptidoglycan hydrolase CwlO-like protein
MHFSDEDNLTKHIMIDSILELEITKKEKIDKLLEYDTDMYTRLGTDSLKKEIEETKKESKRVYKAIKTLDENIGNELLRGL